MIDETGFLAHLPRKIPVLTASPFLLRGFDQKDFQLIERACLDPSIQLVSTVPAQVERGLCEDYLNRQRNSVTEGFGYSFVIADQKSDEGVGSAGLWLRDIDQGRASIGYWVLEEHRGKRAASLAVDAICKWALIDLHIPRLELIAEAWNDASMRVGRSAGFVKEGLLRSYEVISGERQDVFIYSLLKGDLDYKKSGPSLREHHPRDRHGHLDR